MAKVRCEYCDNYIEDIEEKCPNCGALNPNYKNKEKIEESLTPQTIEELKEWYIARNLPPEEITRFFIGKDISEPKTFGIYRDGDIFIVYKNKADGSRAIRYKGDDEAYAVNELYLRLKEEILNQKSRNKIDNSSKDGHSLLATILIFSSPIFIPSFIILLIIFIMNYFAPPIPTSGSYYVTDIGDVYYYDGYEEVNDLYGYLWFKLDKELNEWDICALYNNSDGSPIDLETSDNHYFFMDTKLDDKYNIWKSKTYLDLHHYEPYPSYYVYDGDLYYYLRDNYSNENDNQSGWYKFIDDAWEYYSDYEDTDLLDDNMYYYYSDYEVGGYITDVYDYTDSLSYSWSNNLTSFEDTSYYAIYDSHEKAHQKEMKELEEQRKRENKWDNDYDSDYDWDSGDSWDSSYTDWDSDW